MKPGNARPFLRWAGGKRWLVKSIRRLTHEYPVKRYHEPFLGGGSVFFALQPDHASLSDLNDELITTYKAVQGNCNEVIRILQKCEFSAECYYDMRDYLPQNSVETAARFIYLNKASFNGIYRVNKAGKYNVPYGKNDNVSINFELLEKDSEALAGVNLSACDFTQTISNIRSSDLVFLDPPYTVSHNRNGFIQYNKRLFDLQDQIRLRAYIEDIKEIGAFFIMTNANHDSIREIFNGVSDNGPVEVERFSGLGGKNAARCRQSELMFTNLPLGGLIDE